MIAILLLLMAAEQPGHGARMTALATARILPGARIAFATQSVDQQTAEPQRSRLLRRETGEAGLRELRLVEFQ